MIIQILSVLSVGGLFLFPFKSSKQRRWMYANKPALARKWAKTYGSKPRKKKGRKK